MCKCGVGGGGTAKDLEKIKLLISLIFFSSNAYKQYPLFEVCVILFTEMENGGKRFRKLTHPEILLFILFALLEAYLNCRLSGPKSVLPDQNLFVNRSPGGLDPHSSLRITI